MVLTKAYCEKQMQKSIEDLFESYKMMISRQLNQVGLSTSSLLELFEEDEYQFIIKAHNLVEHFVGILSRSEGLDKATKNYNKRGIKFKLDTLLKAGALPQLGYDFIRSLSLVRNKFAHDPRFINYSIVQCVNALSATDKKLVMSAFVGFFLILYPVRSFDEVRYEIMALDPSEKPEFFTMPEFDIRYLKLVIVSSIYALVVFSGHKKQQEDSAQLWLKLGRIIEASMDTFSISTFGVSLSQFEKSNGPL